MAPTQAQPALRLPGLCLRTSPGPRSLAHRGRDGGEQPVAPQGGREPSSEYSSPGPGQAFVGDEEYNLNPSCLRPLPEVRTDSPASLCESRRPTFCVLPSSARRLPAPLRALGPQREAWGSGSESLGVLRQQQGAGGGGGARIRTGREGRLGLPLKLRAPARFRGSGALDSTLPRQPLSSCFPTAHPACLLPVGSLLSPRRNTFGCSPLFQLMSSLLCPPFNCAACLAPPQSSLPGRPEVPL